MEMSSTSQDTGMSEAQAAEKLFARYQSDDHGNEGETQGDEPEAEEADEPEALADGDDADEAESEQADEPEEKPEEPDLSKTFKVKVGDEEAEVTLKELIRGFHREQDYTRKTQAVAQERQQIADARAKYEANLGLVAKIIESNQPRVNQALRDTNPAEWSAQMLQHRQWAEERQTVEAERTRLSAEQQAEQAKAHSEYVRQQQDRLPELIPEWRDANVAKAEIEKLRSYGLADGLDEEDLDSLTDARAVKYLRKSMLYDELMAKKPEIRARVDQVKTLTPGAKTAPSRQAVERRARERLANDGSTDAAVALILARQRRA